MLYIPTEPSVEVCATQMSCCAKAADSTPNALVRYNCATQEQAGKWSDACVARCR